MFQHFFSLPAFQHKFHIPLIHGSAVRLKKPAPSRQVNRVAVHQYAIQIENGAFHRARHHRAPTCRSPGQVVCTRSYFSAVPISTRKSVILYAAIRPINFGSTSNPMSAGAC